MVYRRGTGRLESGHTLTGIVGSNPTLSATPLLFGFTAQSAEKIMQYVRVKCLGYPVKTLS